MASRKRANKAAPTCEGEAKRDLNFRFTGMVKEDHKLQIYYICFCDQMAPYDRFFATVGANRASVYECEPGGNIKCTQVYADDDVSANLCALAKIMHSYWVQELIVF